MFADHFVNQTNKEAQWAGEHGFGQKNIPGINHKILILEKHATKESFNNYVDIILPFFEYLSRRVLFLPLTWTKIGIF